MAIKADGNIIVDAILNDKEYNQDLKKFQKNTEKATDNIEKESKKSTDKMIGNFKEVGATIVAAFAGVAVIDAIKTMSLEVIQISRELTQFSQITGLSVTQLDALRKVSQNSNLELNDTVDLFIAVQEAQAEAIQGNEEFRKTFQKLGINVFNTSEQVFNDLIKIANASQEAGNQLETLGQLKLAGLGAGDIKNLQLIARDITGIPDAIAQGGDLQTEEQAKALDDLTKEFTNLTNVLKQELLRTLVEVAPTIKAFLGFFTPATIKSIETFGIAIISVFAARPLLNAIDTAQSGIRVYKKSMQEASTAFANAGLKGEAFASAMTKASTRTKDLIFNTGAYKNSLNGLISIFKSWNFWLTALGVGYVILNRKTEEQLRIIEKANKLIETTNQKIQELQQTGGLQKLFGDVNSGLLKQRLALETSTEGQIQVYDEFIRNFKTRVEEVKAFLAASAVNPELLKVDGILAVTPSQIANFKQLIKTTENYVASLEKLKGKLTPVKNEFTSVNDVIKEFIKNQKQIDVLTSDSEGNFLKLKDALEQLKSNGIMPSNEAIITFAKSIGVTKKQLAELFGELEEITVTVSQFTAQEKLNAFKEGWDLLGASVSNFGEIFQMQFDREEAAYNRKLERNAEELADLEEKFGKESNIYRSRAKLLSDQEDRAKKDAKRAFERSKALRAAEVVFNTSSGIMATWSNYMSTTKPATLAAILAGVQTAALASLGAAQLGAINNEKFINGGMVDGNPFATDTQQIRTTGGEFVVNPTATQDNLAILDFINRGGQVGNQGSGVTVNIIGDVIGTDEFVRENLMPSVQRAVRDGVEFAI